MENIFKRHEKKYLISREQGEVFQKIISPHMEPDQFGEYLVQNIYYDNESWDVIRASIEKPVYKEKIRLRCYDIPEKESRVFLELKKKYLGVGYKFRIPFPFRDLLHHSIGDLVSAETSQISKEIDYIMKRNSVSEKIFISYTRAAFNGLEHKDLRITFDTNIRFRLKNLNFSDPVEGMSMIPYNKILMEIKTFDGMPFWMARALCEQGIFPAPFSKYGKCYTDYILKEEQLNA